MVRRSAPDAGDIVWLHFDPQAGHEQFGYRPAVVLSPATYNRKTGLMLCCPMTTRIKGYPFEVPISGNRPSVVLADQVKSLDWVVRKAERKGRVSSAELADIRAKAIALIGKMPPA
ncbi:MAG: endoribonuclease MazF [Candidatus Thiosymbion ectosymbiont of Robbea hypermnestra]|nr:endoribonuclease MazF [Candidatus Thiosymbion ectosymbiont of Robbea hypermnestra]